MPKKICIIVSIILCLFVGTVIFEKTQAARHNKVEFSSYVSIEEILDIEELHMMMYPYKGIAEKVLKIEKKNGDTSEKTLYKVLYNGHAVIGTKEKIGFSVLDEENILYIHIPELSIIEIDIDFDSIDYIFTKYKYETETVSCDSYSLCLEDMRKKLELNEKINIKAEENIKNLITGLINLMYPEYEIKFE